MTYIPYLLLCLPALLLQYPVVAVLLLTKWGGYTTIFGNEKWGRGNTHYKHATKGYWQEFLWLTYRNPINNLLNRLCVTAEPYTLKGNPNAGDKTEGGQYFIRMGKAWEYYLIIPYGRHCVRVRLGWKIKDSKPGDKCPLVFMIRPIMNYRGR